MKITVLATITAALLLAGACQAQAASFVCGDPAAGFNVRLTLDAADGAIRYQDFSRERLLPAAGPGGWRDGDAEVLMAEGQGLPELRKGDQRLPCVAGATDKAGLAESRKAVAGDPFLDVSARSWGGKLRAGPDQSYAQTGSLAELSPVRLIRAAGVPSDGMDWFEVRLPGGKRGFQWGGILCVVSQPVEGVFGFCPAK